MGHKQSKLETVYVYLDMDTVLFKKYEKLKLYDCVRSFKIVPNDNKLALGFNMRIPEKFLFIEIDANIFRDKYLDVRDLNFYRRTYLMNCSLNKQIYYCSLVFIFNILVHGKFYKKFHFMEMKDGYIISIGRVTDKLFI